MTPEYSRLLAALFNTKTIAAMPLAERNDLLTECVRAGALDKVSEAKWRDILQRAAQTLFEASA
jgi:hypothetical protein